MSGEVRWRRCSACKGPIGCKSMYWVCSVSTCNRKRTGLVFCSVSCWEVHLPTANHREAWALERTAPDTPAQAVPSSVRSPEHRERRRIIPAPAPAELAGGNEPPTEVLIVASRLKEFVRARSGFKTSDRVLDPLSRIIRRVCDQAIENAKRDGRTTVLERDIPAGPR